MHYVRPSVFLVVLFITTYFEKEVTVYDKRRAEMKEHIKAVFDESHQRFGANKIAAVLSE